MRLEFTFASKALERPAHVTVITPDAMGEKSAAAPVLWLLHGTGGDRHSWLDQTAVAHYARTPKITLVLPEANNSFYTDMTHGEAFFTHIAEEVPALLERTLRIDWPQVRQYLAGFSMGGYGALKLGLRFPERYAGIGVLSGALRSMAETKALIQTGPRPDLARCFGDCGEAVARDNDIFCLTEQLLVDGKKMPPIYQYCGQQDPHYPENTRYRDFAAAMGLPMTWVEDRGGHTYKEWDAQIKAFIKLRIVADSQTKEPK